MIHLTKVRKVIDTGNLFSMKFWKKDGEVVFAQNVISTSSYHGNNTINIKFTNGEFRKVKAIRIFEFNGEEVCL